MKSTSKDKNQLYPLFFKADQLPILIIGGGPVALEKLSNLLLHSPDAQVVLVGKEIDQELREIGSQYKHVRIFEKEFEESDLDGIRLVISALNDIHLSEKIGSIVRKKGLLYNAADKPELCDFYLSSVISKGNLKIAISTNGKSPTVAKRLKELLNDIIPEDIDNAIEDLDILRPSLKGDFQKKVTKLNKITSALVKKTSRKWYEPNIKRILLNLLFVLTVMISGHIVFSILPPATIWNYSAGLIDQLDSSFLYFMLGGFIAQMIDGALGMAYGVSATTFLLSFGISPAVASMSVHASEIFTSGVSGLMHLKFGNVHNRLFKAIVIPGVLGAILGAYVLTEFENYSTFIKPIVGVYTLFLGILIIYKVVRKKQGRKRVKRAGLLATFGGFLDSIGGGGWGPVVSSTLIAQGKHPRLVVGSVNLAEFFVSLASSFTFLTILGGSHWQTILGLILGGVCAAPIAALLSKKLNVKAMMLIVGIVIIIVSLRIILLTLLK
jgi:siroheme synthase-like protein